MLDMLHHKAKSNSWNLIRAGLTGQEVGENRKTVSGCSIESQHRLLVAELQGAQFVRVYRDISALLEKGQLRNLISAAGRK